MRPLQNSDNVLRAKLNVKTLFFRCAFSGNGGEGEIRTRETFQSTRFPGERTRPGYATSPQIIGKRFSGNGQRFPFAVSQALKCYRVYVFLISWSRNEANCASTRDKAAGLSGKRFSRLRPENFRGGKARSLRAPDRTRSACERIRVFWSRRFGNGCSSVSPENP